MPIQVKVKQGRVEREPAEVLVLPHFEQDELNADTAVVDKVLRGQLRALLERGEFQGKSHQTAVFHTRGDIPAPRILLVGLGKRLEANLEKIRQAFGTVAKRVTQLRAKTFTAPVSGFSLPHLPIQQTVQAMVEGAVLGSYQFTSYRTEQPEDPELELLTILDGDGKGLADLKTGAQRGQVSGEATSYVRDLCNHPANTMTPARIAQEAEELEKERGVRVKVLERRQMEKLGMGAVLGVARGSHEQPRFIILEYSGGERKQPPIVLVGKTITFDTGGISLKPAENMEQMKADMTGGAEVLAITRAAARLRLPVNLVGILPATENMPGGSAIKPGDILTTLSGKTVEVQNTDAEGRLILADGLFYATRYKPETLIDVATLTGACSIALGSFAIGMLGNHDQLKQQLKAAGDISGERVWEMPLWDEYFEQLKSDVADMRNIGGRPAGMITAGMFLSKFVGATPWVHLDIASTDWSDRERPYIAKGPTGIGTRLLLQYLLDRTTPSS